MRNVHRFVHVQLTEGGARDGAPEKEASREGGTCTMERRASRPSRWAPAGLTGTPMTGRGVRAATIPGRCAAPPAPAIITCPRKYRRLLPLLSTLTVQKRKPAARCASQPCPQMSSTAAQRPPWTSRQLLDAQTCVPTMHGTLVYSPWPEQEVGGVSLLGFDRRRSPSAPRGCNAVQVQSAKEGSKLCRIDPQNPPLHSL